MVKTKPPLTCDNLLQPEEIPFLIAKPRYSYTVRFQVVGNKVRALLLAPAEDLPSQSLVYSYKIAAREGREIYAMPIGGYHVLPGYIEQQENTDWEATNVLGFKKVPIRKRGKYKTESIAGIPSSWPTYQDGKNDSQPVREVQFASEFTAFKSLAEQGGKRDVYPKSFFSGDWYYASTVITNNVSSDPMMVPGLNFSKDNQLWVSNKIRFYFRDRHLIAYTLNKETEHGKEPRSISPERVVFKIPITHLDYRTNSPLGELNSGLEEIPDITKEDRNKKYFQAQFDQIELSRIGRLTGFQLNEITVSEDYFSFVLRNEMDESQLRFSFLRPVPEEDRVYKPLVFNRTFENFPVFFDRKRVNPKDRITHSEEFQNSLKVQRFNLGKPIVYRFSTLTPDSPLVRNIGRETVAVWAQIFEKAGVSCPGGPCVTLLPETQDDAELGDIRYNILNLISPDDFLQFGPLNGLGPSITDFETGEVISVTANLYLDVVHARLVGDVYRYIQSRSGLILSWDERQEFIQEEDPSASLLEKRLLPFGGWNILVPQFLLSWNPINWKYNLDPDDENMMDLVPLSGSDRIAVEDGYETANFLSFGEEYLSSESREGSFLKPYHTSFAAGALNGFHCKSQSEGFLPSQFRYRLIDTLCGEHLTLLKEVSSSGIKGESPHERRNWLWEKSKDYYEEEIYRCADKLLKFVGLGVGIHEVGHNMSMPHNFAASADKKNFLPAGSFHYNYTFENDAQREKVLSLFPSEGATASVMEYMPSGEMRMVPGKYDTDFIRFLYRGEMETENGELVTIEVNDRGELLYIDSGGELVNQREIRRYKTCDERSESFNEDIYCSMFDRGTTPSEIVGYYRGYFMDNLSLYGSSLSFSVRAVGKSVEMFFESTKKIYHKWRVELSKDLNEPDPLYLKEISAERYRERIADLLCEGGTITAMEEAGEVSEICGTDEIVKDEELAELYKARTIIYRTFRDLLFSTKDHYCIFENMYKDDLEEWVPFSDIHRHLTETSREDLKRNYSEISSCEDLKESLYGRTGRKYIGETGVPLLSGVFSIHQNRDYDFYRMLKKSRVDYSGNMEGRKFAGKALFGYDGSPVLGPHRQILSLMNEPDIREDIVQSLTDRILQGVRVNITDEEEPLFHPVFSNEELLWRFLALPIFQNDKHFTTGVSGKESLLKSLAVLKLIDFVNRQLSHIKNDFVQMKRVTKYNSVRRRGGYIIHESKELYPQSQKESALALFNTKSFSSHLTDLIQSLKAIDLRKSFLKFTGKIHEKDPKDSFQNKKEKANSYMEDLKKAVKELYSDPSLFVNMLTFSLLYDYLEVGESSDFSFYEPNYGVITNLLVQQLQIVRILEFRINRAFEKKFQRPLKQRCTEGSDDCVKYHLIFESDEEKKEFHKLVDTAINFNYPFGDMIDTALFNTEVMRVINAARPYIIKGVEDPNLIKDVKDPNLIKSVGELIQDCRLQEDLCGEVQDCRLQEDLCGEVFDLVQELYLMELFRSDHHVTSQVHTFLKNSLIELQKLISEKKDVASVQRRRSVLSHIAFLRTLADHANSKLFQEIFIRNMLFHSWGVYNGKVESAVNSMLLALDRTSFFHFNEFFDRDFFDQTPPGLQRSQIQKDTQGKKYQATFLYNFLFIQSGNFLQIFQDFRKDAPDILERSFNEIMDTVRIAPPFRIILIMD